MIKAKVTKFVKVEDDWHPNFPDNEIRIDVQLQEYPSGYYDVFIRAWGADDFCLELKRNGIISFDEAHRTYCDFKKIYDSVPKVTNKDWFYKHGFMPF